MAKSTLKAKPKPKPKPAKLTPSTASSTTQPVTPRARELLDAILATPRDTKARLVYADLMQELGDPRGELIVLQCARAELADDDPRGAEMDARSDELLKEYKKPWITSFGEAKGARWVFRRGFVEKLSMDTEALERIGAGIFAVEPIEELSIWKIRPSKKAKGSKLPSIFAIPGVGRARFLSLARSELKGPDIDAVASATTLGNVETLDLTACMINAKGIARLAEATSLPKLTDLRLGNNVAGDTGVKALAASALPLVKLVLVNNEIGNAGAEALANARFGSTLTHLDLSTSAIDSEGMRALAESKTLTALRWLKLEYCRLDDQCVDAILASQAFAKLEHLDVSVNLFGDSRERLAERFGTRLR